MLVDRLCFVMMVAALTGSPSVLAQPAEYTDASIRQIQRTVTSQRDGAHLPRLFGLRQLHDPALRPLLYQLAQGAEWPVQVHAILGLAEIETTPRIDPWLVTQVDEHAQEALIANALDLDLLGVAEMRELLDFGQLPPSPRLLLLGELMLLGETIDLEPINAMASSAHYRVAGLASLLVAGQGDLAPFSAYSDRLDALRRSERDRHLLWLLEAIRQYEIKPAVPWVQRIAQDPAVTDEVRYWSIYTLLLLAPEQGLTAWQRRVGNDPSQRDRIRYATLLLAAAEHVPPSAFDALAGTEDLELVDRMADAGRVIASGADASVPLERLIDLGHPRTTSWVMTFTKTRPPAQAAAVYSHVIDAVEGEVRGQPERIARAIEATSGLYAIDPDTVLDRLTAAEDDSLEQEVLLLGLFEAHDDGPARVARTLRRIGAGRADSIALLLIAQHAETLPPKDLKSLGRIAAGGGRVSEGLQTQAAWLYLRLTGSIEPALARVFDDSP